MKGSAALARVFRRLAVAPALLLCAACGDSGPWYDTAPDPDLSYLPLVATAWTEESLDWSANGRSAEIDAYLPSIDGAPVALVLPGAFVVADRYRWLGATLASYGVATLIVQPDTAFGSSAHIFGTIDAAAAHAPWASRIDLSRLLFVGHSAGCVAEVGLTDVAACPMGFCGDGETTPPALRGLILLGYHNIDGVDDDAPMAAVELPWLVLSGTRDGLATPEKVAATVTRIEDRPLHAIQISGANHYQLTDYVDPVVDVRLPDDLDPAISNRAARATAAAYVAAFVQRYLSGSTDIADDLGAAADKRVVADTRLPRLSLPAVPELPRLMSERRALPGLSDAADAVDQADIVASALWNDARYLLVRNAVSGAQVYRLDPDGKASMIEYPDGAQGGFYGNRRLEGLLGAMVVFRDELYVGVTSGSQGAALKSTGAEVWAWNGTRWRPVVSRRVDADPEVTVAELTGCSDADPRATLRIDGAAWTPGAWVGAVVDDVDHPRDVANPLVWSVVASGTDTLTVQANDVANDDAEDTACDRVAVGARLSLRVGRDESGFGEPWNKGIAAMAVHDDKLYVGVALNYEDGAELMVSEDGVTFGVALARGTLGYHGNGVPITTSISALGVSAISGTPAVYAGGTGSQDYGARLYAVSGGQVRAVIDNAVDADQTGLDEAGMGSNNQQVMSITEFGGRLWIGALNFDGLEILSSSDGTTFRRDIGAGAALGQGFGDETQLSARLVVAGGYLWAIDAAFVQSAGELGSKSGAAFRTRDGVRWQQVTAHAFGTNAVQVSQLFPLGSELVAVASSAALAQPHIFRPLRFYTLVDHEGK